MAIGTLGVLNVGAGDTKLTFDKDNPAECIRSGRIVADMLKRGYALLIEVPDGTGGKSYTRVKEFREDVCSYIIADFDPIQVAPAGEADHAQNQQDKEAADRPTREAAGEPATKPVVKRGPKTRSIPASSVPGIAVARSAGG
jgi:hypothetical protein